MGSHYNAFIVVALITLCVFAIARPVFTRWMSPRDFANRRNAWLAITAAAFLLPDFWLFVVVSGVIILIAGQRDSNAAALYLLLLLVVPPIKADLPTFGIVKTLFSLQNFRLLSIALLIPVAVRLMNAGRHQGSGNGEAPGPRLQTLDVLLIAFLALQLMLFIRYESGTNSLRRGVLMLLDVWLPYYVVSRSLRSRQMIVETMSALVLAALVLASLAAFESAKGWLLYGALGDDWHLPNTLSLRRSGFLRAVVTGGHSIVLGYFFSVALGMWLFLQRQLSRRLAWLGFGALAIGLAATFSRGPWLGAVIVVFAYLALGPSALRRTLRGISLLSLVGAMALATPLGDKILSAMPFVGHIGAETVSYREHLFRVSLDVIQLNPIFGSPNFLMQMEELRTGEGIIDLVNAYLAFALAYGLVGLGLFVGFMTLTLLRGWRLVRDQSIDPDFAALGASLLACLCGILVMLATASNYLSIPYVYLAVAGLIAAYCREGARASIGIVEREGVRGVVAASGLKARPKLRPHDGSQLPT